MTLDHDRYLNREHVLRKKHNISIDAQYIHQLSPTSHEGIDHVDRLINTAASGQYNELVQSAFNI